MSAYQEKKRNGLPNILGISLDSNLVLGAGARLGDSTRRVQTLASVCRQFHVLMRTFSDAPQSHQTLGENCHLYPTNSRNRMSFIRDATVLGSKIINENPIDVIYTQDPFTSGLAGYALKRKHGKPLILSFAGDMIDNPHWLAESPRNKAMNLVGKWLIKKADAFRVCSTFERQKLIAMGVPPERIHVIGWICDFSIFERADGESLRNRFLSNGFDRLLLFAGRLVKQKNVPNLIEAMKTVCETLKSVLLVVVGEGEESANIKEYVKRLGIEKNVIFLGAVKNGNMPNYFAACDVFVLPSLYEGNAIVVMEAAAAGRPTVSTNVSGASDTIIDRVTGFIVENHNPAALAEKIIELLRDPARMREMGCNARSHVTREYSEQSILDKFQHMFEQMRR